MAKSPDAFRTISEVADWLGVEAHVLRFWETKFTQVKPVKRAGGRRYYRPSDMALLGGIRRLLHDEGMTIRGVQKVLREQGVGHVSGLSHELRVDGVELAAPAPARRATQKADGVDRSRTPAVVPEEESPTLPFDLPPDIAADTADGRAGADGASPAATPGDAGGGPVDTPASEQPRPEPAPAEDAALVPARLRAHPAKLDQAAAGEVLARARALLERLRNVPE